MQQSRMRVYKMVKQFLHMKLPYHMPDWTGHLRKLMTHVGCYRRHIHAPVERVQPLWVNRIDVHPDVVIEIVTGKGVKHIYFSQLISTMPQK